MTLRLLLLLNLGLFVMHCEEQLSYELLLTSCRSVNFTARELVVGWHGIFAGLLHMHCIGIVDQDIHLGNLLQSLDGKLWVKADLGNAVWCLEQTPEGAPTRVPFPMYVESHSTSLCTVC